MADEILGNCYELITEVAITDYASSIKSGEGVFSQETPIGIGIVPDLIIGKTVDQPRILIQVHHTKAERASEKKFWRNIGEYVDARNALGMSVQILTITFDSGQKRKLSQATLRLMDGFLEVDREPYGLELLKFAKYLENLFESNKLPEEERFDETRNELQSRPATINAANEFANALDGLFGQKSKTGANWFQVYAQFQSKRPKGRIPQRKLTTLRRALGRFLPVDDENLLRSLLQSVRTNGIAPWPQYFIDLGIVRKKIGGAFFKNPCPPGTNILRKMEGDSAYEIFRMTELFSDDTIISLWKQLRTSTRSLSQACETIISSNDFPAYHNFIVSNFPIIVNHKKLKDSFENCFNDPNLINNKIIGLNNPEKKGCWLFDYLMTIIKSNLGKQQGYGYTKLAIESGIKIDDKRSELDFALPKMLNRTVFPNNNIVEKISKTISKKIKNIGVNWLKSNQSQISSFYLKGVFEDKIYKTSSFDPIFELTNSKISKIIRLNRKGTYLTDLNNQGSATCDVIIADNNLIMWQSASIKGDHHKTKELIGRIGMLVVEDNGSKINSAKYKQTILVIDGSWTQDQIQRLNDAGFDRIYYVDEIDLLKTELNL